MAEVSWRNSGTLGSGIVTKWRCAIACAWPITSCKGFLSRRRTNVPSQPPRRPAKPMAPTICKVDCHKVP